MVEKSDSELEIERLRAENASLRTELRRLADAERDRAGMALCINESLAMLIRDMDFRHALEVIMEGWSVALGAQWCHLGRFEGDYYSIVHYYSAPGEHPILEKGVLYPRLRKAFDEKYISKDVDDYQAFPDCKSSPYAQGLIKLSPHPDSAKAVSSSYSHLIRLNGEVWGMLGLKFRERHVLTEHEERFFRTAAKSIELALQRHNYKETLEREHAEAQAAEADRLDKERRVKESLELFVSSPDIPQALQRIMSSWCEALCAQWCFLGRIEGDDYEIVQSQMARGKVEILPCKTRIAGVGRTVAGWFEGAGPDAEVVRGGKNQEVREAFAAVSSNGDVARSVSACYSHAIRFDGKLWGTLVFLYDEPHTMTRNEELFFKELAKGVQLALIRDSYRRGLERERDRALEAERSKSLFFSSVSHDIRTPLNAIIGFSEMLSQGVTDPVEHDRYVQTIHTSGRMLVRLVNDVLDFSKMESGRLELINEPTDIPALVREIAASFDVPGLRKSLVFRTEIAEMPRVDVDPQRIRQLLHNLLSNAFKYTDSGSVTLRTVWKDGVLDLSVADTGRGISRKDIDRILQPFVQVADKNHRDGTGLGLSICQRLVKRMGGELTVESELGKGSVFTIRLSGVKLADKDSAAPVAAKPEPPAVPKVSVKAAGSPAPSHVLIVDDSPVNLAVLRAMLKRNGVARVVSAENGKKALEVLESDPGVDAVLTDLWMPELDGEGLVRAIRADARFAHLPVYLITADVEALKTLASAGFTDLLLKPITSEGVRKLLKPEASLDGQHQSQ